MSEIFNFRRFGNYFLYDLKQMWRKHSRAAILIGFSVAIFYAIWVLFGLIIKQTWAAPPQVSRFIILMLAFAILELYQTRTYGYLTEKQAGSAWLMVPASRTEKFISMLLMTLVVIPLLFFAVFFSVDAFLCLVDPTCNGALISGFFNNFRDWVDGFQTIRGDSPVVFSMGAVVFMAILGFFCNFLYFLLCGVCFKKNKIVWGLLIIFFLSVILSILFGLGGVILAKSLTPTSVDEVKMAHWAVGFMNASEVVCCLLAIGLGWGIWRRIKTIQH